MLKFIVFFLFLTVSCAGSSGVQADVFLNKNSNSSGGKNTLFNSDGGDSAPSSGPIFFNKKLKQETNPSIYNSQGSNSGTVFTGAKTNRTSRTGTRDTDSLSRASQMASLDRARQESARRQAMIDRNMAERERMINAIEKEREQREAERERLQAAAAGDETFIPGATEEDKQAKQVKKVYSKPKNGLITPKKVFNTP